MTLIFALVCAFYFDDYFEMIICAFLIDVISFGGGLFGIPTFLVLSTIVYFGLIKLKKSLFNSSHFF